MSSDLPAPAFKRPFVHVLSGAHFPTLARMLLRYGGCAPRYIGSVAATLAITLLREPSYLIEAIKIRKRVSEVRFDPPPVIILGHWRSGTTFLHNIMSRDPRFAFPTIVDACFPYEFFPGLLSDMSRKMLVRNLPAGRQVDDVPLRPDLPQEEEVALATMGAPSFFNCLYFPKNYGEIFRREVLFDGLDPAALETWRRSMRRYLAKITALDPSKQLLLKNPASSARVAELKAMFPNAKFINIHRDPFEVFMSMRRMLHVTFGIVALQDHDVAAVDEEIMALYPLVIDRLHDGLADTPHAEVRYADLVADPISTLRRIYAELDIPDFGSARPAFETFAAAHATSARSQRPRDPELVETLRTRWRRQFARLGYA